MRLIVAITGASGVVLGVRVLEYLNSLPEVETHLVVSRWARRTLELETPYSLSYLRDLADVSYPAGDQAAQLSSGSFRVDGMVVVPCTVKTLAAIRSGYASDLVARAADVVLKERRRLVLVARETPLSTIHLENMLALSRMGVTIMPPMPAFYNRPSSIEEIIDHLAGRILDQFGLDAGTVQRWAGMPARSNAEVVP